MVRPKVRSAMVHVRTAHPRTHCRTIAPSSLSHLIIQLQWIRFDVRMPRMATQAAVAQRERLVANQHALRRHVIVLAAAGTVMILTKRPRFIEQGARVRHARSTLHRPGQYLTDRGEPYIYRRRKTIRIVDVAPSTRSNIVIARKTRPKGPTIRTAATTGGSIGMDSFTPHAAAAPAAAAVHSFAT